MGVDSGRYLSTKQNKCSKSKTEFFEQFIDHSAYHIHLTTQGYSTCGP